MSKRVCTWIIIGLLAAATTGVLSAQTTTTTMIGNVIDSSGAAVSNAQVVARNVDTNLERTTRTNTQGEYRIEFLPVGNYVLEASAVGFKKFVQNNIVLQVDQPARVDATLGVGHIDETVTVNDAPPLINILNSEIGRTVESREIRQLPLVNRNVYTLLDLTPGVQANQNSTVLGFPEQRTFINGGVDGGAGSVNYYLDGGTNMTGLRNTGNILPNPDAIQEFRVQTNNYSAEFGRYAGGVINTLTRSGTNNFHGSLFEFVRNNIFNANDWGSTLATPPLHRNQFGGTFGGPIRKSKTFFFGSYSGLRQISSTFLATAIVPTALERAGDFSQSGVINDPLTVTPAKKTPTPFPNGIIPVDRRDPVAMRIINTLIPVANAQGNTWQGFIRSPYNTNEFLSKVDHALTSRQQLTASYFETSGTNTVRAGTGNLPWSTQQFSWRQHNANVSDTWAVNANLVNQSWLSYTRNFGGRLNLPQTSLGDLGSQFTIQGTPSLSQITVTGQFTLSNAIAGPLAGTNFYAVRDVLSYNNGRHAFKFGAELSLDKDIQQTLLSNYGAFTFSGAQTKNALADFELGLPSAVTQDAPVTGYTNSWYTAFFVQDDFRISQRLTLNLGLRHDVQTPPTDPLNRESTYVPGAHSTVNPAAPVGELFAGDTGITRGIVPTRWNHFSPRIGFAWDPNGDGKTAIRGGVGVFYGSVSGNQWNTTTNFEPFAIRLTFNNAGTTTGATLSNPYRGLTGGDPFPYHGAFVSGGSIFGISKDFRWPYSYQANFSLQRQITNDLSISAAYVGTLSHNLPFSPDANYPLPTFTDATGKIQPPSIANIPARRPNGGFGSVLLMQSNQTASYHALQLTATKRMGYHFTLNSFYTFSRTFDSVQLDNNTTQGGAQNMTMLAAERGLADFDQRHVFVTSIVWQPDYYTGGNPLAHNVLNGWQISPIVKLHSGTPFTVLNGVDANLDGSNTDRAQLVGDPNLPNPGPGQWFNTAAFAQNIQTPGSIVNGNTPRNFLTGPSSRDVDVAVSRTFKASDRFAFEFRGEAINVFNMVTLSNPGNTFVASTPTNANSNPFGRIRTANVNNPMRQLQLGLRLTY